MILVHFIEYIKVFDNILELNTITTVHYINLGFSKSTSSRESKRNIFHFVYFSVFVVFWIFRFSGEVLVFSDGLGGQLVGFPGGEGELTFNGAARRRLSVHLFCWWSKVTAT